MNRTKAEYIQEVARGYYNAATTCLEMAAAPPAAHNRRRVWLSDAVTYQKKAAEQYGISRRLMGLEDDE